MAELNQEKTRRGLRATATYAALVVVPALVAITMLTRGDSSAVSGVSKAAGHPLAQLLLSIAVVVALCKAVGLLMQRIGQPPVIGEIAAGVLLGPSVLGALWPAGAAAVLPPAVVPQLNVVAQLGVVFFLMLAGLEVNVSLLRGRGRLALLVSHVSIAFPFMLGVGLAALAYARFAPQGVGFLAFALFFGISMSVTALPVLVRILQDTGLFRTDVGVVALTCALIDDVTAWSLLALVVALVTASSLTGVVLTVVLTIAFVAFLGLVVRPLLARLVTSVSAPTLSRIAPLAVVATLLSAMATEWIGVHAMFGAFMFGLVMPRDNPISDWLHDKAGGLTTALMLPMFFAYSGLRTDIGLLNDVSSWLWCGAIVFVAIIGKLAGSAVAARAAGESWNRSLQIGTLMNCRGLTELIVLNIGLDLGVLSPTMFTMMVIMALISTAMAAPLAAYYGRRDGQNVVCGEFGGIPRTRQPVNAA